MVPCDSDRQKGQRRDPHGGDAVREDVRGPPLPLPPLLDPEGLLEREPVAGRDEAREQEEQE